MRRVPGAETAKGGAHGDVNAGGRSTAAPRAAGAFPSATAYSELVAVQASRSPDRLCSGSGRRGRGEFGLT